MEKEKLKFKLDAIPERFGGGYKAKMCARKTVGTLDVIGEMAAALNLSPRMLALHFKAVMDAVLQEATTTGNICRVGDYFTIEPHVRGRFDGIDDTFDPTRGHAISLTVKPGRKLKAPKIDLKPENERRPCVAWIGNVLSVGCETKVRCNRLVFGYDLSIVGRNLALLEGDAAMWKVQIDRESLSGHFEVLENDATRLLLRWPETIPPAAIGHDLAFSLTSRGGDPEAVRRTVGEIWPIIAHGNGC